jgi:hypothetical protein
VVEDGKTVGEEQGRRKREDPTVNLDHLGVVPVVVIKSIKEANKPRVSILEHANKFQQLPHQL